MKSIARLIAIAVLSLSTAVLAQQGHEGHLPQTDGVIKKIDAPTLRVMLAHGPIANLGMGPMTMMFKVKEAALLKSLKEGDKVRFRVEEIGGEYTIVRIEAAK